MKTLDLRFLKIKRKNLNLKKPVELNFEFLKAVKTIFKSNFYFKRLNSIFHQFQLLNSLKIPI